MSLTAVEYAVLQLAHEYLTANGKKAITYDSLIAFARKHRKTEYKNETITRTLRRLAEAGFFERKYVPSYTTGKRIALYIPTEAFWLFFQKQKSVRAWTRESFY